MFLVIISPSAGYFNIQLFRGTKNYRYIRTVIANAWITIFEATSNIQILGNENLHLTVNQKVLLMLTNSTNAKQEK